MTKLTTNINGEILNCLVNKYHYFIPCYDECRNASLGCQCVEQAKMGLCPAMDPSFNDFVMFSTGTGITGFYFAVAMNDFVNIEGILEENPWGVATVDEIIEICLKNNEAEVNEEALKLFKFTCKHRDITKVYKHRKVAAKGLSKEYYWIHYPDGSGSLEKAGEKRSIVSYGTMPYGDEIEYKYRDRHWNAYFGEMDDFKEYIESRVKAEC